MNLSTAIRGYWLERKRDLSDRTVEAYAGVLRDFSQHVGDVDISSITPQQLREFLNVQQDRGVGDWRIIQYHTALRSLFKFVVMEFDWDKNPMDKVGRPKKPESEPKPIREDELIKLIAALQYIESTLKDGSKTMRDRPEGVRDVAMTMVFISTGCRLGDVVQANMRDYNQDTGQISFLHRKGKKQIHLTIPDAAAKSMWQYLRSREDAKPDEPLFLTRSGKRMSNKSVYQVYKWASKRAGIPNVNPHRFRHSFSIEYIRNGGDISTLGKILSHSSTQMTLKYLKIAQSDLDGGIASYNPLSKWDIKT